MFCPNCGTENDNSTNFCTSCGTPLATANQPVNQQGISGGQPSQSNFSQPAQQPAQSQIASNSSNQPEYVQQFYQDQPAGQQGDYQQPPYGQPGQQQYQQTTQPYAPQFNQTQPAPVDSGSFGWAVLGFFIPLVGLILFLVWKTEKPKSAKMSGIGALVGFCLGLVLNLVTCGASMSALSYLS